MASEATKMAVRGNMHMIIRVLEVTVLVLVSNLRSNLTLEISEDIWRPPRPSKWML